MSDKSRFDYWFMERNGLWSEYVQEAREQGFEKASPLARLIYSCEIGSGIDQHASEDLKAVSATIAALRERCERLEAEARELEMDLRKEYGKTSMNTTIGSTRLDEEYCKGWNECRAEIADKLAAALDGDK